MHLGSRFPDFGEIEFTIHLTIGCGLGRLWRQDRTLGRLHCLHLFDIPGSRPSLFSVYQIDSVPNSRVHRHAAGNEVGGAVPFLVQSSEPAVAEAFQLYHSTSVSVSGARSGGLGEATRVFVATGRDFGNLFLRSGEPSAWYDLLQHDPQVSSATAIDPEGSFEQSWPRLLACA